MTLVKTLSERVIYVPNDQHLIIKIMTAKYTKSMHLYFYTAKVYRIRLTYHHTFIFICMSKTVTQDLKPHFYALLFIHTVKSSPISSIYFHFQYHIKFDHSLSKYELPTDKTRWQSYLINTVQIRDDIQSHLWALIFQLCQEQW